MTEIERERLLFNIRPHLVRLLTAHSVEINWRQHEDTAKEIAAAIEAISPLHGYADAIEAAARVAESFPAWIDRKAPKDGVHVRRSTHNDIATAIRALSKGGEDV